MPISPAAHYISCLLHQLPITTASTLLQPLSHYIHEADVSRHLLRILCIYHSINVKIEEHTNSVSPCSLNRVLCQVPQLSAVLRTNDRGSNPRHRLPTPVTVTTAATQTEPPQQYDYAYR